MPPKFLFRPGSLHSESKRMFPDMPLRNVFPATKHKPPSIICGLPHWGLYFCSVFSVLILFRATFEHSHPRGLLVNFDHRNAIVWDVSPQPAALSVFIRAPNRFFVDGEEVRRHDLRAKLLQHHHVSWVVYFDADVDTAYMETAYAIDIIQSSGANLIWITPKLRESWRLAQSTETSRPAQNPSAP
jgi:biopolymer transport protein ExbD